MRASWNKENLFTCQENCEGRDMVSLSVISTLRILVLCMVVELGCRWWITVAILRWVDLSITVIGVATQGS